ncbi:hypothetical protein ASL20_32465 [Cupriavidus necator]|nr:hypothetical protein ASL20_32465 [Cupriavidus necator]
MQFMETTGEQLGPNPRMPLHNAPFLRIQLPRFEQHMIRNGQLTQVMNWRCKADVFLVDDIQPHYAGEATRNERSTNKMA